MKRRRRNNKHLGAEWHRGLLRLLSLVALVLFLGQSTLSFALAIVARDTCGDCGKGFCPYSDDDDDCPCPLPCASCCGGSMLSVVPPAPPEPVVLLPRMISELTLPLLAWDPPCVDPGEILHVPKA